MKQEFNTFIRSRKFKRGSVIFLAIEIVFFMIAMITYRIDIGRAVDYPVQDFRSECGTLTDNGLEIDVSQCANDIVAESEYLLDHEGIYRFKIKYSVDDTENRIVGKYIVVFLDNFRNIRSSYLRAGKNNVAKVSAYIYDYGTESTVKTKINLYEDCDFTLHELKVWKKSDWMNNSFFLMGITAFFYVLFLLFAGRFFPDRENAPQLDGKERIRRASYWLALIGFALTFISAVHLGMIGLSVITGLIYIFVLVQKNFKEKGVIRSIRERFTTEEGFLFLFFLFAFIAGFFAVFDAGDAVGSSFAFLGYLMIYTVFRNVFRHEEFKRLMLALAVVTLFVSLFSIIHLKFFDHSFAVSFKNSIASFYANASGELSSLVENWPTRGGYKLAIISLILMIFTVNEWKKMSVLHRILFISAILVALIAMVLTHTRGAILYVLAGVFFFLIFRLKLIKAILIFVPIVAIIGGLIFFTANEKIKTTFTEPLKEVNVQSRLLQFKAGWEIISENNLATGIGLMNFTSGFEQYAGQPYYYRVDYIHNMYISLIVETGIIGVLIFLTGLLILLAKQIKNRKNGYWLGGGAFLFAFLFSGLVDSILYSAPIAILVWQYLGLTANSKITSTVEIPESGTEHGK